MKWTPRLPWGLSWKADFALPVVVGLLQVAAGIGAAWHHSNHHLALSAGDWALLFIGPVALVARRRHPVAVLWTTFAATLTPAAEWART